MRNPAILPTVSQMMIPGGTKTSNRTRLVRALSVFDLFDSAQDLVCGIVALGIAAWIWKSPVPAQRGPATQQAAQTAHDGMLLISGGLGALFLLIGLGHLSSFLCDLRQRDDGTWG